MKWILGLVLVCVMGGLVLAQEQAPIAETTGAKTLEQIDATAVAVGTAPIRITDTEATVIVQTIKGYMQDAMRRGRLDILDRKKGEVVKLRLDRIVTDDPQRVAFLGEDRVAICGECTQMAIVESTKGVKEEQETGDKYEVWFVMQRGGLVSSRVLDTFVKSVNGQQMYKWTQDTAGQWSATLVPDAE